MSIKKVVDLETIKKVLQDDFDAENLSDFYLRLIDLAHEEPQAGWITLDVKLLYPNLTQEQTEIVLERAVDKFDASLGFTWDNITWAAKELQKELDLDLTKEYA